MNEICLSCRKHTKCGRAKAETIGCGYYVPMTNEEWFTSLSTEEKARFFDKICYSAWGDINSRFRDMADYTDWVEWLKQQHKDTK